MCIVILKRFVDFCRYKFIVKFDTDKNNCNVKIRVLKVFYVRFRLRLFNIDKKVYRTL